MGRDSGQIDAYIGSSIIISDDDDM